MYRLSADALVVLHFCFVLFVVGGALLVLRWPPVAWLHVPAALWGAYVEFSGRICPLTPWENALREAAGVETYGGDFVEHYIMPVLYPDSLTTHVQIVLGTIVVVVNVVAYAGVWWRRPSA